MFDHALYSCKNQCVFRGWKGGQTTDSKVLGSSVPVERLVPDAGPIACAVQWQRQPFQVLFALFKYNITLLFGHQIHFVYQAEDFRFRRILEWNNRRKFCRGIFVGRQLIDNPPCIWPPNSFGSSACRSPTHGFPHRIHK